MMCTKRTGKMIHDNDLCIVWQWSCGDIVTLMNQVLILYNLYSPHFWNEIIYVIPQHHVLPWCSVIMWRFGSVCALQKAKNAEIKTDSRWQQCFCVSHVRMPNQTSSYLADWEDSYLVDVLSEVVFNSIILSHHTPLLLVSSAFYGNHWVDSASFCRY